MARLGLPPGMECCRVGSAACLYELACEGPALLDETCLSANCSNASPVSVPLPTEASILPHAALQTVLLQLWFSDSANCGCRVCLGRLLIGTSIPYGTHVPAQYAA